MKFKKKLFPFILMFAILLTCTGIVTVNKSFAVSSDEEMKEFSLFIKDIKTSNINVLSCDTTNMTYILNLDENKKEYGVSFTVVNDNKYNLFLTNYYLDSLPEELKDIIDVEVNKNDDLNSFGESTMSIKYTIKNDITNEQKKVLKNNKNIKVNLLLNYIQK